MRKKRTIAIAAGLSALMMACAGAANTATATPTGNSIYVDGKQVNGAAYMINSNNYFKLRDIAAMVNGSAKQFEVSWNQAGKRIDLTTNKAYTVVGGELALPSNATKSATESKALVFKDGTKAAYTGYTISDNNYYKLRDLCKDMDIGVKYDNATKRVDILTTVGYGDEDSATTPTEPTTPTTPEQPTTPTQPTTPSKPTTGTRRDDVGPRDTDLRQADDKGIKSVNMGLADDPMYWFYPSYGRYSAEYQNLLDTCGEKIITKTIHYYTECSNAGKKGILGGFPMQITVTDSRLSKSGLTAMTLSINGEGSFELKMPESLYKKTLAGEDVFSVIGTSIEFTSMKTVIDGKTYDIYGADIDSSDVRDANPTRMRIDLSIR
ncbi:hypothetical protein [Butyricicoccus sp. OF27-2pH9A]|uniref:hypothetical protein n=1 Tax=Butyricicoccus sp. OF27-2pH9A TaxID=3002517 RepID=UPI0022E28B0E|nr:hypothetical protein [Butyricicoccus sp. OF27-2pH9A]